MAGVSPQQLEQVMLSTMLHDTGSVAQATDFLKRFMKNIECIPALVLQTQHSQHMGV